MKWQEGLATGTEFQRKLRHRIPNRLTRKLLGTVNMTNIEGAVRLYEGFGLAVVDRLHAHILASLLGITHVVLDNSYGKISAVYEDYTG